MTTIQSLPSSAIAVPAFGQGSPIQAPVRVEANPLRFDQLAEAVLARPAFALAGASMQPQLRAPDGIAIDEARVRDALAALVDEQMPADAALQRSFERHVAGAAEIADEVASSQDGLSDAGRIKFDPFFGLLALLAAAMQALKDANRELSVATTEITTEAAKRAGQLSIDQATKNLIGSAGQGALALTAGVVAVGQTAQAANITATSVKQNVLPQQTPPGTGTTPVASTTTPSTTTPSPSPTPRAAVDDVDLPTTQPGLDAPDAVPSPLSQAPSPSATTDEVDLPVQANVDPTPDASALDALRATRAGAHEVAHANAQTAISRGQMVNMIAQPVSGIAASSAQAAGAADEAERLEVQAEGDTAKQISSMLNDQVSHDNALRDALFQAMQALNAREVSNAKIIGNM